ncbi:MAG: hypothetical protein DWQ07_25755 [Chloroflexi bacterium]|nr:MAG: hypothetical protein DWQ07_25755 [Chloroflexota bacterium]
MLKAFSKENNANPEIGISAFPLSTNQNSELPLESVASIELEEIERFTRDIPTKTGLDYEDAFILGTDALASSSAERKIIIMVTDGKFGSLDGPTQYSIDGAGEQDRENTKDYFISQNIETTQSVEYRTLLIPCSPSLIDQDNNMWQTLHNNDNNFKLIGGNADNYLEEGIKQHILTLLVEDEIFDHLLPFNKTKQINGALDNEIHSSGWGWIDTDTISSSWSSPNSTWLMDIRGVAQNFYINDTYYRWTDFDYILTETLMGEEVEFGFRLESSNISSRINIVPQIQNGDCMNHNWQLTANKSGFKFGIFWFQAFPPNFTVSAIHFPGRGSLDESVTTEAPLWFNFEDTVHVQAEIISRNDAVPDDFSACFSVSLRLIDSLGTDLWLDEATIDQPISETNLWELKDFTDVGYGPIDANLVFSLHQNDFSDFWEGYHLENTFDEEVVPVQINFTPNLLAPTRVPCIPNHQLCKNQNDWVVIIPFIFLDVAYHSDEEVDSRKGLIKDIYVISSLDADDVQDNTCIEPMESDGGGNPDYKRIESILGLLEFSGDIAFQSLSKGLIDNSPNYEIDITEKQEVIVRIPKEKGWGAGCQYQMLLIEWNVEDWQNVFCDIRIDMIPSCVEIPDMGG